MKWSRNILSFLWHAFFLALTLSFMDVNTVAPDLIIKAGGSTFELGILTALMIGGASLMQLAFAAFLHPKKRKKPWLLLGVNLRILALAGMGLLLLFTSNGSNSLMLRVFILALIALFSFSGSFANISYVDIMGRAILPEQRKPFFVKKQLFFSVGILLSAILVRIILKRWVYPTSHGFLFLSAAALLLVASVGFWIIKEPEMKVNKKSSKESLKDAWKMLKSRGNLRNFLIVSNLAGVAVLIIPFVIMQARDKFGLSNTQVGNYLLVQVIASLAISLIMQFVKFKQDKAPYRDLLVLFILLGALLPVVALVLASFSKLYFISFILSGFVITLFQIVMPGILVEITGENNRAWITALAGALNVLAIIFPLVAGALIGLVGYFPVFIGTSVFILSSLPLALKMDCTPVNRAFSAGNKSLYSNNS